MQNFMDRAKLPLRLTYRAVGSSTGQYEFIGEQNGYKAYNEFGSGDIPVSTEKYNDLKANDIDMLHLPFVMGAISFFVNIPGVPDGPEGLNLTSCLLSKILKRDIKVWDHDEIVEVNPNLKDMLPKSNYPITVAHRVHGSSSTASVTQYLHTGCPDVWTEDLVGKEIEWHEDTKGVEGSGGMSSFIRETGGSIGYVDAGHGHEENLVEIELKNADGKYISSKRAGSVGIGAAAGDTPLNAGDDFGGVELLNKPGPNTWPIVAMSYIYLRKDITFIDDPIEQSLLKAFIQNTLLDADEIQACSKFGFTPVPEAVRNIALEGLNTLIMSDGAPTWEIETDTIKGIGQGDYYVSKKRRSYAEYERSILDGFNMDEELVSGKVEVMVKEHLASQSQETEEGDPAGEGSLRKETSSASRMYTDSDAQKLQAALVLSAISFSLWALALIALIAKKMCGK